jgi:ribosomal protein S18 acetylase RimI-like enzyme
MPEIEIRPASPEDLPTLCALDHSYTSDFVWQMEVQTEEEGKTAISFREIRLPRSVRVDYPRAAGTLLADWEQWAGILVARLAGDPVGYAALMLDLAPATAWMTDLVVKRRLRRQGIGSALVLAAQEWGLHQTCRNLILEMQPKNYPAIHLAQKLGFDFCGYNDRYFLNHDIGLFFAKTLR